MKLSRISVTNYRGIATLEQDIAPAGTIVSGSNGKGKTSFLKAIRAALAAQDIGTDAVRLGEDRAEILINIDDIAVRRVITQKGPSLTVTRGGMNAKAPQTFLSELLGTSPLDPLDLLLARPKERRAKILEALPLAVTIEQLRTWVPSLPDTDVSGHGLEVLARVRAKYYADRTEAKKRREAADVEAKRAGDAATAAGLLVKATAPSLDVAKRALDDARANLARLEAQDDEATKGEARTQGTRDKVAKLRTTAAALRERAKAARPGDGEAEARGRVAAAQDRVASLERELSEAKQSLLQARDEVAAFEQQQAIARGLETEANAAATTADDIEATLAETAAPRVAEGAFKEARARAAATETALFEAQTADNARSLETARHTAHEAYEAVAAEVDELESIMKTLTSDAPAELLAGAKAIPGLGLDGDDVTLDGKKLDALCGAESMRFCVDIAKRLNAKSRILIVDGLERLDPEQREDFVRFATADGFQLLASCVDRGEPVFAAIEDDSQPEAAE